MLNLYNYHSNPQSLPGYNNRIKFIPELALEQAIENLPNRSPDLEPFIMTDPLSAYLYAKNVIKNRWKEAEHIIITDPNRWNQYKQIFNIK